MRSVPRGPTAVDLLALLLPAFATGCFVDAPDTDDAASSSGSSTTDVDPTGTTSLTTDVVDTSTTASADTTGDPVTSGASSSESSTTGTDPAQCGCPEPHEFCDGFEMFPGPWSMPDGGGGIEQQDNDDAMCGVASGLLAVEPTNTYAVATGNIDASAADLFATPHVVRTFMKADLDCANQGDFVRVLEVQYKKTDGSIIYSWQIALALGQMRLTSANINNLDGGPVSYSEAFALPADWFELQLLTDFTVDPPTAAVLVDGDTVVDTGGQAPEPLIVDRDTSTPGALVLGPYIFDTPFTLACAVRYDDISVAFDRTD